MKVALCLFLVVCMVAAERKAPYLPSGWKPEGPAFLLPSEVQRSEDNPLKSTVEVEASGSDFLREYGPPKVAEITQELSNQGLPEVATEQSFAAVKSVEASAVETEEGGTAETEEGSVDNKSDTTVITEEDTAKDGAANESSNIQVNAEVNDEDNLEEITAIQGREDGASRQQVDESVNEISEVKEVEEETHNVADALDSLEQKITSQQELTEEKTVQQVAGVPANTPTGFLEYGPPKTLEPVGLTEYGPPQEYGSPLARSGSLVVEDGEENQPSTLASTIEVTTEAVSSEARRRRFSPRLRPVRRIN